MLSADSHDLIRVQGARVNNLKGVSVEIPNRRLTAFTGVSGSGKSSLVFGRSKPPSGSVDTVVIFGTPIATERGHCGPVHVP